MKLDLHVHTSEVSGCGKVPAAEMVRLYHEAGYDAIVITDHLIAGKNAEMPMDERAGWYLSGYRAAKAEGERLGLTVILGAELRFDCGHEDYLLYGITEADVAPIMRDLDGGILPGDFYRRIRENGRMTLIQAHPFRPELRQAPLDELDGIEVYNGHPEHDSHNDLAMARAMQGGEGFIKTSGSDAHKIHHVGRGGMIAEEPIADSLDLARWLRAHPNGERIETR